jgi:hypothetical protein
MSATRPVSTPVADGARTGAARVTEPMPGGAAEGRSKPVKARLDQPVPAAPRAPAVTPQEAAPKSLEAKAQLERSADQLKRLSQGRVVHGPAVNQANQNQQAQLNAPAANAANAPPPPAPSPVAAVATPPPPQSASAAPTPAPAAAAPKPNRDEERRAANERTAEGDRAQADAAKAEGAKTAGQGGVGKDGDAKRAVAQEAPAIAETVTTTGGRQREPSSRRKIASGTEAGAALGFGAGALRGATVEFAEPERRLRWRIAGDRRIESSSDAGTTWTGRYTSVAERLRAGSAPSVDAAWVVGERGLVLRRVVPGDWIAVARPATATLTAIAATSADAARVTADDGRVFVTTDGGQSWTPVPAAPQ